MELRGTSLVGGEYTPAQGRPTRAVNAETGEPLEPAYHWATHDDVDRAARLAADAFELLSASSSEQRAALLRAIASGIELQSSAIVARATAETALPASRIQAEIARTCGQLRLFAALIREGWYLDARIDRADPARAPIPKPDVRSILRPLGPVAVFSSSNFPLAFSVAGGDTASALAAGCPVVVKPHQGHLGTSELVARIVSDAVAACELPPGTFSLVYGPGRDVGIALVTHPLMKAVGFTGSRAGGRALMDAASARTHPIPVYAEMGSVNPVFLLPGALAARGSEISKGLHASVTLGYGQFCTNPGLVFCLAGEHTDQFVDELAALMSATLPGAMLTPSIADEYSAGVARFSAIAGVEQRAHTATEPASVRCGTSLFVTDFATFSANSTLMDEVFGPSTVVVKTASHDEMMLCASRLDGQLTGTVHATPAELEGHRDLIAVLERRVGRLVFNGFPTGVEVCHAMNHGGPYPATSDGRSTSVGTRAITRFLAPVCYQNWPDSALPAALRDANPLGLARLVDGVWGVH